jgi:hypothetical protein
MKRLLMRLCFATLEVPAIILCIFGMRYFGFSNTGQVIGAMTALWINNMSHHCRK